MKEFALPFYKLAPSSSCELAKITWLYFGENIWQTGTSNPFISKMKLQALLFYLQKEINTKSDYYKSDKQNTII